MSRGEMGVQGAKPFPSRQASIGSKARDLAEGVHTGIGAAGAHDWNACLCDRR